MTARELLPRVLFVDDEQDVLDGFRDALRRKFQISVATSGAEALKLLEAGPFTVVVSDFMMPGMNGAQFLSKARIVAPTVIRVLLTGQATMEDAINAVNQGNIFRFLRKPCASPDLARAIDDAVEQSRIVTADRDLLERKLDNMAGHLLRAERLASLGTMACAVGHELNNVLAVFVSTLEFVREAALEGNAPCAEDLESLEHVKEHLVKQASNLLEFGRPRSRMPATPTDFVQVVRDSLEMLRAGGALRRVALAVELPDRPYIVDADKTEASQVILNVIKNAVDAAVEAGKRDQRPPRIAIGVRDDGGEAVCTVLDNGGGIPAGDLPLIFEPYFTTKSPDNGTGLGLFVVRQILERHAGSVCVTSEEGSGTEFTIRLPISRAAA